MTIKKCDMCKSETNCIAIIEYKTEELHKVSTEYWRDHIGGPINMQGTRAGKEEYCVDCFRKICWAIGNVWSKKYDPTNPVKL